ncbi:hypothetical protein NNO07_08745 [Pseudomonas resinovorans]|uniref:SDR family NAD(P)-dependent oxidoreductase n=1 Tax=Metapseudomonas resinovorans TaxID=53412 RepID=A0ABT4Y2S5_METRE|nr:hypothetical protein [Pseudomonas resinovorans]MDA8483157.1 hypothetical protein [Pseudomonas resinovorans]
MTGALSGKSALITGGTGALARASALALVRDSASVLLLGRRTEALEAPRNELRRNPHLDELVATLYGAEAMQDALAGRSPLRRAE